MATIATGFLFQSRLCHCSLCTASNSKALHPPKRLWNTRISLSGVRTKMPGSVHTAVPVDVLPFSTCTAFQQVHEYAASSNLYADGSFQCKPLVTAPRRRWKQTRRLIAADLVALRAFVDAHVGKPFYYYDPVLSGFTYDPTGAQTLGRFTVIIQGGWSQESGLGRSNCTIELAEVF